MNIHRVNVRELVLAALFAALTAVSIVFLKVQTPTGLYHLGDGFFLAAALVLGPRAGALAGGLGGFLGDLLAGALVPWAPISLVIKAAAGYLAGRIGHRAAGGAPAARQVAALLAASLPTLVGYPLAAWVVAGWPAAVAEFYFDLGQAAAGVVIALVLTPAFRRILARIPAGRAGASRG